MMSKGEIEQEAGELDAKKGDQGLPFYPLFAAVFPILAIYSANLSLVPLPDLIRPLTVALVGTVLIQVAASLLLRDRRRGAAAAAGIVAWLWSFGLLAPKLEAIAFGMAVPLYVVGGVVVTAIAAAWRPKPFLPNLLGACITGFSAVNIAWLLLSPVPAGQTASAKEATLALPPGPRPDIFHLILDGFGRTDVLKERMDLNLDWFVEDLEKRGFHVLTDSRTSYVQTELSVASTLNMDMLQNLLPAKASEETSRLILKPFVQQPAAAKKLMASGYRYIAIGTGFDGLWLGKYQIPSKIQSSFSLFEGTLLSKTPWQMASGVATSQFDLHRESIKGAFSQLEDFALPTNRPRFVVAHILAPHPPFVFDENGGAVRPKGPFGFWDGSDYLTWVGSPESYREGYKAKATYIAKRILLMLDKLQAQGRRPVIILQGDHGSKVGLDQNSLDKTDLKEAFSNFYAISVPKDIPLVSPDRDTSVNTYRRLFSAMGEKGLEPYPAKSWYSTAPLPFVFSEVTSRLDD